MQSTFRSAFTRRRSLWAIVVCLLVGGALAAYIGAAFGSRDRLVVYCAHDSLYAEKLLHSFQQRTGIPVAVRFDTEATKSLGLVNLLIREKDNPRCDVFWNNQVQGTLDLCERGLLVPYKGPGFRRIPDRFKDPEGHWVGFAARLRVYIVNTHHMAATTQSLEQALAGDLSRMAVAKPLYGTTRSHYTLLWHHWGFDKLASWHHDVRRRGIREVGGNATVKNLVAAGKCDFGWTDTDDFFLAQDEGKPVAMLPLRLEDGATICIPNTVSIMKGTGKLAQARKLVEFLLSAETEMALAHSKARQVPLGPIDTRQLKSEVRQLAVWAQDACDLTSLGTSRQDCLDWLKSEYLR